MPLQQLKREQCSSVFRSYKPVYKALPTSARASRLTFEACAGMLAWQGTGLTYRRGNAGMRARLGCVPIKNAYNADYGLSLLKLVLKSPKEAGITLLCQ